jgi:hypothetical protein
VQPAKGTAESFFSYVRLEERIPQDYPGAAIENIEAAGTPDDRLPA